MHQFVFLLLTLLASCALRAEEFCTGAPFVPLQRALHSPELRKGARFQTRGLFRVRIDFSILYALDTPKVFVLLTDDDVSDDYERNHRIHYKHGDALEDYYRKLRELRGKPVGEDYSELNNYRQQQLVCGRLLEEDDRLVMAVDDFVVERTFIIRNPGGP